MLPNLGQLQLAPTGVRLSDMCCNDKGEEAECLICTYPLSADSPAHPWTGPGIFLEHACASGHVYHKGCLRTIIDRKSSAVCPECRAPLIPEVVQRLKSDGAPSAQPAPSVAEQAPPTADPDGFMARYEAIVRDPDLTPGQRNILIANLRRSIQAAGRPRPELQLTDADLARLRQLRREQSQSARSRSRTPSPNPVSGDDTDSASDEDYNAEHNRDYEAMVMEGIRDHESRMYP